MDIWASAIIAYIHAPDPEVVILGGVLKARVIIHISANEWMSWLGVLRKVPIVPAILGDKRRFIRQGISW